MIRTLMCTMAFAVASPLTAAVAPPTVREAEPQARPAPVATLDQRSGWGLIVGLVIVGLALRRRRGPVVSN